MGYLIPVIVLWGMVAVVTFLKRKHIGRFLDGMPYSDALSYLFVILGVFSYFGVLQQFFSALVRSARLGDSLVVFALLSRYVARQERTERQADQSTAFRRCILGVLRVTESCGLRRHKGLTCFHRDLGVRQPYRIRYELDVKPFHDRSLASGFEIRTSYYRCLLIWVMVAEESSGRGFDSHSRLHTYRGFPLSGEEIEYGFETPADAG